MCDMAKARYLWHGKGLDTYTYITHYKQPDFFMCEKGQIITLISYIINKLTFVMCDKGQILVLRDISSTKKSNSN